MTVHKLKSWIENFDALLAGGKSCEVREEGPDRIFKVGEFLELTRTGSDGEPTMPHTTVIVKITHVDRLAGPLNIVGVDTRGSAFDSGSVTPIAVLSLERKAARTVYEDAPVIDRTK